MVHKLHTPDSICHLGPKEIRLEIEKIAKQAISHNHFMYDSLQKRKRDLEMQRLINRID